jgi:carbon-monoxide dehydrogenase iron sulfur subunit
MNGVIFVDVKKCLACRSCELECAVAHSKSKNLSDAIRETPLPQAQIKVEGTDDISIPLQCRHCEDAPCVKICPTKAIEKIGAEGPVIIKDELCVGCKFCILVCPFGVIGISHKGRVAIKCDLCIERLKENKLPACVAACTTKALRFISLEELSKVKREKVTNTLLQEVSSKKRKNI